MYKKQKAEFVNACISQSILIVLYMFTLARMFYTPGGRLNFVIMVTVLLMISCFTWIFYTWLIYRIQMTAGNNAGYCKSFLETNSYNLTALKQCSWSIFVLFVNTTSYNIGIWLFTMRFWTLARLLKLVSQGKELQDNESRFYEVVALGGIIFIVLLITCSSIIMYYKNIMWMRSYMPAILWLICFGFMACGMYSLRRQMQQQYEQLKVYSTYYIMVFVVAIAIVCQVADTIVKSLVPNKGLTIESIIVNWVIFGVQFLIIIIFNQLIKESASMHQDRS